MKRKFLLSITALAVFTITAVLVTNNLDRNSGVDLHGTKATEHTLTLNSGTATGLTASFGDAAFDLDTDGGNTVGWEVKNGKTMAGGLVTLGKNTHGNANHSNYYIGNTDPITSINNVTVSVGDGETIVLFGSNNNSAFYKIDFLTSSNPSSTVASNYHYLRFVNGSQVKDNVNITSISITYSCVAADYTDEISDITSHTILKDDDSAVSYDTESLIAGFNSTKSMKITKTDVSQYDIVVSLGVFSIPATSLGNYQLEFYVNGANNTAQSGKNYFHVWAYPATGTKRNTSGGYFALTVNNGTAWTKHTLDLSTLTSGSLLESETYNSLYIRIRYLNGSVGLDQMRIAYKSTYPTYSPVLDNDDLAIASNVVLPPSKNGDAYAASDDLDYVYNDGVLATSNSSLKFTANKVVSWSTNSVSLGGTFDIVNDAAKVLEFYVYFGGVKGSEASASTNLRIQLAHPKDSWSIKSSTAKNAHVEGSGLTTLGEGWYKYSYPISDFDPMSNGTEFSYIHLQLAASSVTQADIDAGVFFVIDRLSIHN